MRFSVFIVIAGLFLNVLQAEMINKDENPGSTWSDEAINTLLDRIACEVGDIVTVIVDEKSAANFKAATTVSKKDANTVKTLLNLDILDKWFAPSKTESNNQNQGAGSTNQTSVMKTSITAVIKQKLPNDKFIIEASKDISINNDSQVYLLSGVISKKDIGPDNTISSDKVAESTIKLDADGAIGDRQRKGLITMILDWLF